MDSNAIVVIAVVAGVVLIVGAVITGPRLKKMWFKGPGGLEGGVEADPGPQRGATGRGIKAREDVSIKDATGQQATGENIESEGSVTITSSNPRQRALRPN